MVRRALVVAVLLLAASTVGRAEPLAETPLTQDPLGPMIDVTGSWGDYQPRDAFCVYPDVFQYPGPGTAAAFTGADPDCAASGFGPTDGGLVKITVGAPDLCAACKRFFIDYARIPANVPVSANGPPVLYAHGHAYFGLVTPDLGATVEVDAHSPNIKNFSNDKLFVPEGSPHQDAVEVFDTHTRAFTGNTVHVVHNQVQGPYYVGPWYVNLDGVRVRGAYLDVRISAGDPTPPELRAIGYAAGFHSGEQVCFDEIVGDRFGEIYRDGDGYYGGCIDGFGAGRAFLPL